MNKKFKIIATIGVVILTFALGYLLCLSQYEKNSEYDGLEKSLVEKLIQVNAATTSGLNSEEFQGLTREVSIMINQLKMHKKITITEEEALDKLINQMSITMSLWNLQTKCTYNRKDKSCLEELTTTLYYDNFPIINPNYKSHSGDERFLLEADNSKYIEYKNIYVNSAFEQNDNPYSSAVSAYLTRSSSAIKNFFLTKGISIN